MAKGKQAALAATRRYEAAMKHIDRLTEDLATAKIRYRDAEADATRLVVVEAELERLRQQVADGTSDALERAEAKLSATRDGYDSLMEKHRELIYELADGIAVAGAAAVSDRALELALELRIDVAFEFHNREERRSVTTNRRNRVSRGEFHLQDNLRPTGENLDRAGLYERE